MTNPRNVTWLLGLAAVACGSTGAPAVPMVRAADPFASPAPFASPTRFASPLDTKAIFIGYDGKLVRATYDTSGA